MEPPNGLNMFGLHALRLCVQQLRAVRPVVVVRPSTDWLAGAARVKHHGAFAPFATVLAILSSIFAFSWPKRIQKKQVTGPVQVEQHCNFNTSGILLQGACTQIGTQDNPLTMTKA